MELVRTVRELVTDSDSRFSIVINNDGKVEEISNSEFGNKSMQRRHENGSGKKTGHQCLQDL